MDDWVGKGEADIGREEARTAGVEVHSWADGIPYRMEEVVEDHPSVERSSRVEDLDQVVAIEVVVVLMVVVVVAVAVAVVIAEDRSLDQEMLLRMDVLAGEVGEENRDVSVRVVVSRVLEDRAGMCTLEGMHLENVDVHHESTRSSFSLRFSRCP